MVMMAATTMSTRPVLTAAGRALLEQRLARTTAALERIASGGSRDLTGDEVAERQRLLERAERLRDTLARAADVADVEEDPAVVEVGDEVDVADTDGEVETLAVVDPSEASAGEGRISAASPLGRALLGTRPGDDVDVDAPGGTYRLTLVARRRLT